MWPHSLLSEILLDLITFQDARGRGVASDWPLVHPQSSVSLKVETRFMNMAEFIFFGDRRSQNFFLLTYFFSENNTKFYVMYIILM